jgi:TRAP-type C4-dicarboxylate transport system permease small subunit
MIMEKFLSIYNQVTGTLSKIILGFAAVIIGLNVAAISAEAAARYLWGSSQAFMEEFPRLLVPFIVFPMMGVLLKAGKHISVEILPQKLEGKYRSFLLIIVYGVILVISLEFCIAGISAVSYFKMIGLASITEWTFPMWWVYTTFPVGFALLIFFDLELLLREIWVLYKMNPAGNDKKPEGARP